ncbi:translation elongation factor Ts [Lachnospiraceae bacterium C1.1]|nr:translation elongation factor Ts [Lachnospiraceae bacterium C1.1]
MAITAKQVKDLREMTGAGMMDCKKALTACDGDMDKAVEFLREKGLAGAQKKAGRIAVEGLSVTAVSEDGKTASVVEVNCETDFAAGSDPFKEFVNDVAAQALASDAADVDALLNEKWIKDPSATVADEVAIQVGQKIRENIKIRRFAKLEEQNGFVAAYVHAGGKIGVLVDVETDVVNDAVKEMGKNVAMQVAAMNPQYISENDISDEEKVHLKGLTVDSALNDPASLPKPILNGLIEKAVSEKLWSDEDIAIYEEKKSNMNYLFNFLSKEAAAKLAELALADKAAISENKIFAGLVQGRVSKQYKELCLADQAYVKAEDGKQSVQKYIDEVAKANGAKIVIKNVVRFETGEGMEKKEEDYAAEVAAAAAAAKN